MMYKMRKDKWWLPVVVCEHFIKLTVKRLEKMHKRPVMRLDHHLNSVEVNGQVLLFA
jgi:hypothetical protein